MIAVLLIFGLVVVGAVGAVVLAGTSAPGSPRPISEETLDRDETPPSTRGGTAAAPPGSLPRSLRLARTLLYVQAAFGIIGIAGSVFLFMGASSLASHGQDGAGTIALLGVLALLLTIAQAVGSFYLGRRLETGRRVVRSWIIFLESAIITSELIAGIISFADGAGSGLAGVAVGFLLAVSILVQLNARDAQTFFA